MNSELPDVVLRPDARCAHELGSSLAMRGDLLLVGAPWRDYLGQALLDPPSACLYRRDASDRWQFADALTAKDPRASEGYARAVALAEGMAVVGAPGHENGDGPTQVHLSQSGAFVYGAALDCPSRMNPGDDVFEEYGVALAADVETVIVGARIGSSSGDGIVYVLDATTPGPPLATLHAPADCAEFGASLSLSNDLLVVGASSYGLIVARRGSAFVHRRKASDDWPLLCRLDGDVEREGFGASVAIDGTRIVVGAPGIDARDGKPAQPGRVDVFEVRGDACVKLASIAGESGFGSSVALRGNRLAVGSPRFTPGGGPTWAGRVGLFHLDDKGAASTPTWIVSASPKERTWLGSSVAVGEGWVFAGAPAHVDADAFVAGKRW